MILTNVFLSIAMFFNSINIIQVNNKFDKAHLSVEKNDVMTLNLSENVFNLEKSSPKYFLDSEVIELKTKGLLNKSFEKNFDDFYKDLNVKLNFLNDEIQRLEDNSQAFSSEYIFHRKNHIVAEIENFRDRINSMTLKEKRKLICYEYINNESDKYGGLLGFSVIYSDKDSPFLIGTIVMPEYIGKLESVLTYKSINSYKSRYKITGDNFYAEPLNYFDRYFLTTVGFK